MKNTLEYIKNQLLESVFVVNLKWATKISIILITLPQTSKSQSYTNALVHEKSPYLLQHAHNPVNWNAWHNKTLQTAVKQQKLMVISIGYAACHWCHVMEKESFSDSSVARLMNDNFVNIKIDREERPDIDQVYLLACQLTNPNGCGWPLNVIALPDGKPVWVGSYLPKKEWIAQLNFFLEAKNNTPKKLKQYANHLKEGVVDTQKIQIKDDQTATASIKEIVQKIKTEIDFKDGGLKGIPKFPMPSLFDFLLHYTTNFQDDTLKKGIFNTLNRMENGGIYDHLAGGFARYSTDDNWQVPHFEKMLYDNAQLISLYARAYGLSKNARYKTVVEQSIQFLEQNFRDKTGGFYSSIDADSDGKEGVYYTWTKKEIEQVLEEDASNFCKYFSITEEGNWENKQNVLYIKNNQLADNQKYKSYFQKLLTARNLRQKPIIDRKKITAWNALMLDAYIEAYRMLGNPIYLEKAKHLADFIIKNQIQNNGQLKRLSYQNSEGFLDDYAFSIKALTHLYQVSFDIKYLSTANKLMKIVFENFKQNENGFFDYSSNSQLYTNNNSEIIDGVMPSSNAVLANVLHDLGIIFQDKKYMDTSEKMLKSISHQLNSSNYYYWANLLMKTQSPEYEVCIVGKNAENIAKQFLKLDNIILMTSKQKEYLPLLKDKYQHNKTMIYVCQNTMCKIPTQSVKKAMSLLRMK